MEAPEGSHDRDIRVAIIGYGLAGAVFHAPLVAATKGMVVSAIITGNEGRAAAAQRAYPDVTVLPTAQILWQKSDEYDLVVVATPNRSHVPLGMAAIDAGVPVVIDKPLAVSLADAKRLMAASEERQVPLTVFQNRRWDGDFRTLRAIMDDEILGTIVRYESRFERYRPEPRPGVWRERADREEGGGLLLDIGSHLIDQALVLFGTPRHVYAEMACRRPGAGVDDDTFLALHFDNGLQAHLWMNVVVRIPGPRLYVSGLRGSYLKYGLDPQETALKSGARPGDPQWGHEPAAAWGRVSTEINGLHVDGAIETLPGQYEQFYTQLAGSLTRGEPLPVDTRDALTTLTVIEAAHISAGESRVVALDEVPDGA